MAGALFVDFCGEERAVAPEGSSPSGAPAGSRSTTTPTCTACSGDSPNETACGGSTTSAVGFRCSCAAANRPSSALIAPGTSVALTHGEFVLTFSAGPTNYELLGALETDEWAIDLLGPDGLAGARTLEWGRVELNDDQRLLLLAMCERRLVDPGAVDGPILANRQGAARLGWSLPKFNRKLDHLCEKLHRAGVAGGTRQHRHRSG